MTAMLGDHKIMAFLATTDAARARAFFVDRLGLRLVEDGPFALVLDAHGTMVRVQKVQELAPHPFTALGWEVPDVVAAVRALAERGVTFLRFSFFEQDADCIWTAPGDGAKVAWFHDPDGNTLSLTQF